MTPLAIRRRTRLYPIPVMDAGTAALLNAGKLEQVCPDCRTREAAGSHCTNCTRPTGPDDWRLTERSDAQRATSGASAHRRAESRAMTAKTANPATVGLGL